MRSTLPYDPRSDVLREASWIERIGRRAIAATATLRALLGTLKDAVLSDFAPGVAARQLVHGIMLTQVMFTGVQALSLVSAIATLIGASIIIQTNMMMPADGELIGRVLVAVVLRELAPLITAIVVAGRSGTAIATELGNMKVNSEILALSSLGVDPLRYVVLPRMVGCVVSVVALMIYFSIVSLTAAFTIGILTSGASLSSFQQGVAGSVMPYDLALFLAKGLGLGTIVGWLSCHFGLEVKSSPTEVPQQASRAVVMSLLGCVVYNTVLTAGFYWFVGPPLPAP
ncbi:MAG: putative transporter, permease component [Polyangiaceae bacterium]|jgi:phospholipid/cholesterol/gamma-HCH transport system permease protein|nr:putative transporter, permease component [Polyangiaceae bacterium]